MSQPALQESYLDIVWKQFRKNRFALISLWMLVPLLGIAVFAPLLASDRPFVFFGADGAKNYPWFRQLFDPPDAVDYLFNMGLVAFLPALVAGLVLNRRWRNAALPGRVRLGRIVGLFLGLTALLSIVFSIDGIEIQDFDNFRATSYPQMEYETKGEQHGVYALIPIGPREQKLAAIYQEPGYASPEEDWKDANDGFTHVLGTDNTGRDVLVQLIYGTRISMTVGFVAVGIYLTIGTLLGAIAGYFGGRVDMIISRVVEVILLFPAFFLIITLVGLMGPSIFLIMVVIGVTGWPTVARLIRGEVLKERKIDYVAAAKSLGAGHGRIIFRHILPNAISPALVAAPFGVAGAIITEAGLSLLGFGVQPPTPSWGTFLNLASGNYNYWWLIVVPSVAIFITVTIFNLVGAGLRDAMDPRMRL